MSEMITRSIIVKADVDDVFEVWKDFENFPKFMANIETVEKAPDGTSHWKMKGPLGVSVDWDAELTRLEENQRIAWNTKDREGDITTSGQVTFTPLPEHNETQVTVQMQYVPKKGGAIGNAVASIFANPEAQLEEDLNNFKNFVEDMSERTDPYK